MFPSNKCLYYRPCYRCHCSSSAPALARLTASSRVLGRAVPRVSGRARVSSPLSSPAPANTAMGSQASPVSGASDPIYGERMAPNLHRANIQELVTIVICLASLTCPPWS